MAILRDGLRTAYNPQILCGSRHGTACRQYVGGAPPSTQNPTQASARWFNRRWLPACTLVLGHNNPQILCGSSDGTACRQYVGRASRSTQNRTQASGRCLNCSGCPIPFIPFIHSIHAFHSFHSFTPFMHFIHFIHSFIHPFILSFTPFIPFIHSFFHSFIPSFHSFLHSFIHSFLHSFIHSFMHAFIH